ncbi:hypothetical protein SSP24_49360 [Streptomyces spinoverrucosus]|uniref:Secreted protein n=1 Tax=Streptomyces spinoverrucosus TaxID=284043 RepID=A0A4Y3VNE3_9ACTN|nr:hypothetical protein [Streptomyces spinoverrucosus]GEC07281.1 hypothetical protein SSP24_49360 [Streptomyces spinoverrucosus]GHB90946.1 hypothetical protein GCM10010397_74030 [Streptomyces spinoverrucosus]
MAASAHLLLSALSDDTPRSDGGARSKRTSAPGDTPRSKRTPFPRQAEPSSPEGASVDPDLAHVCVFSAEGACTEAPLTSEPPLPDAEPLTSEPPLAVPDADCTRP